jgi:hypothetical protein
LTLIVETELKLDPFEKELFVFCNRQMNKLKILHFDNGFWLYYFRLEYSKFKWPMTEEEAIKVNLEELSWLLKGYEVRTTSKFKLITKQTDGYTGYNKVENIQRLYCLAHIRRKFYEIVSTLNEEALKTSIAAIGLNYCEQLY